MAKVINHNAGAPANLNGIDFAMVDGRMTSVRDVTYDEAELFNNIPGFHVIGELPFNGSASTGPATVDVEALRADLRTELEASMRTELDTALDRAAQAEQRAAEAEQRAIEAEQAAAAATAAAAAADAAASEAAATTKAKR